jgi:hypothetical protein
MAKEGGSGGIGERVFGMTPKDLNMSFASFQLFSSVVGLDVYSE